MGCYLVGAAGKETWGEAYGKALDVIIRACLTGVPTPPADQTLQDLRRKVAGAIDGCFDVGVEVLVERSPATLADPVTVIEVYWWARDWKVLRLQPLRHPLSGPSAAIHRLLESVSDQQ